MNREEAIANLNMISVAFVDPVTKEQRKLIDDTFDMAIKALEQEPCEDAIDRKLVCAFIAGLISDDGERKKGLEYIRNMPPVNPQPCEEAISRAEAVRVASGYCHPANVAKELAKLPPVNPTKTGWIPVSERLPEDLKPVNITWVNHEPEPYYHDIKDKNFVATGMHYRGRWYWYSTTCADYLGEYGSNDIDKVDDAVEIVAWMPLPKPYEPQERSDKE